MGMGIGLSPPVGCVAGRAQKVSVVEVAVNDGYVASLSSTNVAAYHWQLLSTKRIVISESNPCPRLVPTC
jgi:hypothetical protein